MANRPPSVHSSKSHDLAAEHLKNEHDHHQSSLVEPPTQISRKTVFKLSNCCKVTTYILLFLLTGTYFIIWIIACNNTSCDTFHPSLPHSSYRLIYSLIGLILHCFIIIICAIFLAKYIYYSQEKRIQERIKKAYRRNLRTLHKYKQQTNKRDEPPTDMYMFFSDEYKKHREQEHLFKLSSNSQKHVHNGHQLPSSMQAAAASASKKSTVSVIHEHHPCCNRVCDALKIGWIVLSELFLSLFYIEFTEFNLMAMAALCYCIFCAIFYFQIDVDVSSAKCHTDRTVTKTEQIVFGLASICQALSIILPGMCINICQKWKCVYQEYYSPPEESLTFKGSKFEAGSPADSQLSINSPPVLRNPRNQDLNQLTNGNLTIIQLRSVLNDALLRSWIFVFFAVQCLMFVLQPIVNHEDYNAALYDQYAKCRPNTFAPSASPTTMPTTTQCEYMYDVDAKPLFVINEICLRVFVPMILISTLVLVISFEKKYYVSRLDAIRFVLSPSSMALLFVISICEIFWWEDHRWKIVLVNTVMYGVTAVLQIYIFVALLDLQDDAYRDVERLYGFRKSQPMIYYIEGVVALLVMIIYLACFAVEETTDDSSGQKPWIIVRACGILVFNLLEIIMLIPIRTISISPKYCKHFKKKNKKKYLRTFRWLCFLNIFNIIYAFIFLCDQFQSMLPNTTSSSNASSAHSDDMMFRAAFAMSFGSIYFSIWAMSQLLPWVIPDAYESSTLYTYHPAIERRHSGMSYHTQVGQVDPSNLGVFRQESQFVSPAPSQLTDYDGARARSFDVDASNLMSQSVYGSARSEQRQEVHRRKKKRKLLKERSDEVEEKQDVNKMDGRGIMPHEDGLSGIGISNLDRYDDVIYFFKNDKEKEAQLQRDNENVNELDKVKSFGYQNLSNVTNNDT